MVYPVACPSNIMQLGLLKVLKRIVLTGPVLETISRIY